VPLKEPSWWYSGHAQHRARLLAPISHVYGSIAARRFKFAQPYTSTIPVICIGNFTAGGTGKTPLAILLTERLKSIGERPAVLTRGYGGSIRGPHIVDAANDSALRTGDEALLLARCATTMVSRDRPAGARYLEAMSDAPTVIVMDDGLQNPSLAKMLRLAVVDARRGLGNGWVIPSGPLRAPLHDQLDIVDAIIINSGPKETNAQPVVPQGLTKLFREARFAGPILYGGIVPRTSIAELRGRPVLAFAGIGHPERFFDTLRLGGIDVVEAVPFKDHHFFDAGDAERLLFRAEALGATLVTTEKDHVRLLSYDDQRGTLAARTIPFQISMAMSDNDMSVLDELLKSALAPDDPGIVPLSPFSL
jgi:tetraacyldisaccharide 4'-kinase